MRSLLQAFVVSALGPCILGAQVRGGPDLVRFPLASAVVVWLPGSWRRYDAATEAKVSRTVDTVMAGIDNAALQSALRQGKPVQLMMAGERARGLPSLNLNAAPAPGATAVTFAAAAPTEVRAALAQVCPTLTQALARLRQRVLDCQPAEVVRAGDRTAAVTRYSRAGPGGFAQVWLIQYPAANVLYSLTLSAPQAEAERYEPLFRRMWEALELPKP